MILCFIFLFKQTTAYERRVSDWSSDVFSSDLARRLGRVPGDEPAAPHRADLFRSHPDSDSPGGGRIGRNGGRDGEQGVGAVDAPAQRDLRGAVFGVLPPRRARLRPAVDDAALAGGGPDRVHGPSVHPPGSAVRSVPSGASYGVGRAHDMTP